jgi:hypothetical protein
MNGAPGSRDADRVGRVMRPFAAALGTEQDRDDRDIVSGSAVPTAARTLPTAPSQGFNLRPNHSMPFVNSSARRGYDERDDQEERVGHGVHQCSGGRAASAVRITRRRRPAAGSRPQVLGRVRQQRDVARTLAARRTAPAVLAHVPVLRRGSILARSDR